MCIFSTKEPGSVAPCQHCGCISNQGNQFGSKGPRQSSLTVFVSGFVLRFCTTLIVFVFAFFTSGICTCICIYHNVFVSVTSHRFGAAVLSIFCDPPSAVICRDVICNCNLWQETTHCKFSTTLHNSTSWGLQLPRRILIKIISNLFSWMIPAEPSWMWTFPKEWIRKGTERMQEISVSMRVWW